MPLAISTQYEFPEKFAPIFTFAPYKVIEGGRGKGASWTFARAMLILGTRKRLFCVCAREIQKSIAESVKKLLEDQIEAMGFHEHVDAEGRHIPARYVVLDDEIRGSNGTSIVFVGVRTHVRKIKSMEGIDIFWAIEATHFTKLSWDIVMPTIRRDAPYGPFDQGSELWIDFNPELASDYTYMHWVAKPPPGAIVIEASYKDNPWFPQRMRNEMEVMKENDYDNYLNVFLGKPRKTLQGAIYAKELAQAIEDGRIGVDFNHNYKKPTDISVDLGRADTCVLWFWQQYGFDYVATMFYGNVGFDWSHYLEYIQGSKVLVRNIYLPHDSSNEVIQAKDSVATQTRAIYQQDGQVKVVRVPKRLSIPINATRQLFPRLHFHEVACADGIMGLTHYRYEVEQGVDGRPGTEKRSPEPKHDWASHPASGLHTYALGLRPDMIKEEKFGKEDMEADGRLLTTGTQSHSWMGT